MDVFFFFLVVVAVMTLITIYLAWNKKP